MRINKDTRIIGQNIILVPYRKEHVDKYHKWMQDKELQELTASEPLTLEEEYEMQKSWLMDENKLTFIVLDKSKYEKTHNEVDSMIGDTNLFFANSDDRLCAEAEIMIAEPWARGRKCGWEAILHMLLYGINNLGVQQFISKISFDNSISQVMFQKIGFKQESKSEVFKEITYSLLVNDLFVKWLYTQLDRFEIKTEP